MFSFTDETWLTVGGGTGGREKKNGRGSRTGILVEVGAGAVDGFHSFVVCGRSALGSLAVMCLEENVGIFADACVVRVKSSERADAIEEVVEDGNLSVPSLEWW